MTDFNNRRNPEQDVASGRQHIEAGDTQDRDHTNIVNLPLLPDADDGDANPDPDDHHVREQLRPSTATKVIATILTALLTALILVTAAVAVVIIAVSLLSYLRIHSEGSCAGVEAAMGTAAMDRAHRHALELQAQAEDYRVEAEAWAAEVHQLSWMVYWTEPDGSGSYLDE
ncbi:hypothetical protein F5144DRAFT_549455 [Chaetomium tenue]|uniref:Uncharacterized protein n=1 Tax=Chaetomium tenue TaxID=1854479 RepID=A0ACB7P5B5_9PEZI|nr:hypothetical protein F5144DRAFT_549455 [Chaetomium globosum]